MWTWSYPTFSSQQKQCVLKKCGLSMSTENSTIVKYNIYFQNRSQWFYVNTVATTQSSKLDMVTHFSLVLQAKDFNPEKYAALSKILCKCYDSSGSPLDMLERYLMVSINGSCNGLETNSNRLFRSSDFQAKEIIVSTALKELIDILGMQSIFLYTGVLLKRKILLFHPDVKKLLHLMRAVPGLAWHRQDWNCLHLLVDADDVAQLTQLNYYVAGADNEDLRNTLDGWDLYVDLVSAAVQVSDSAKESLALGKVHKDIAQTMTTVATTPDSDSDGGALVAALDAKTRQLLDKLATMRSESGGGVRTDKLRAANFHPHTENLLMRLAAAENILEC